MLNTKKIEQIMTDAKITKATLCKDINIGRTTFDAILKGSDLRISTLEAIANYLNVKIGFLFDEEARIIQNGSNSYQVNNSSRVDIRDHRKTDTILDNNLAERVKLLEALLTEKDERIADLKERINELKTRC